MHHTIRLNAPPQTGTEAAVIAMEQYAPGQDCIARWDDPEPDAGWVIDLCPSDEYGAPPFITVLVGRDGTTAEAP